MLFFFQHAAGDRGRNGITLSLQPKYDCPEREDYCGVRLQYEVDQQNVKSRNAFPLGRWVHVAVIHAAGTALMYWDGVPVPFDDDSGAAKWVLDAVGGKTCVEVCDASGGSTCNQSELDKFTARDDAGIALAKFKAACALGRCGAAAPPLFVPSPSDKCTATCTGRGRVPKVVVLRSGGRSFGRLSAVGGSIPLRRPC